MLATARFLNFSSPAFTKANHITCSTHSQGKWKTSSPGETCLGLQRTSRSLGGQTCELESQPCPILLCDLTQVACCLWAIVAPSQQRNGNCCSLRVLSALNWTLDLPISSVWYFKAVRRWSVWEGPRFGPWVGRKRPQELGLIRLPCLPNSWGPFWPQQASHQVQGWAAQWLQPAPACRPLSSFMRLDRSENTQWVEYIKTILGYMPELISKERKSLNC